MNRYNLKYRPINELIAEVNSRLYKIKTEVNIDPSVIIKAAYDAIYDLGLKVYWIYERVFELENRRLHLPQELFIINYILKVGPERFVTCDKGLSYSWERNVELAPFIKYNDNIDPCNITVPEKAPVGEYTICDLNDGKIYQICDKKTIVFDEIYPVELIDYRSRVIDSDNCLTLPSPYSVKIYSDILIANFDGKIYLNYYGLPIDEEGVLLLPDNPILNRYFEWASIKYIFENVILNETLTNDLNVKFQMILTSYNDARYHANSLVNRPDFKDMVRMFKLNRKILYNKYYSFFSKD